MLQLRRKRTRYFAKWAMINKEFSTEKHTIENGKICYDAISGQTYANHIEMAGFFSSSIISYGIDKKGFLRIVRHVAFPTLRMFPNDTRSQLDNNFAGISLKINGKKIKETVDKFVFDGILRVFSHSGQYKIEREICSSRNAKACIEHIVVTNNSKNDAIVEIVDNDGEKITNPLFGNKNERFRLFCSIDNKYSTAKSGAKVEFSVAYCAAKLDENFEINCIEEIKERETFGKLLSEKLVISTPNEKLNTMLFYTKLRAAESIFQTKSGLMHSPGGGGYYAALWTNDQCEYANPFFAYLGYDKAIEESINCYELYKKYISADKALITSIVAEGDDFWNGAKDRGDSAMYAYGCARFLLAYGDKKTAENFVGAIEDCLTYTASKKNNDGVIASDSDELENRFASGKANLSTSCLAYDAFVSASYLEKMLGENKKAQEYLDFANELAINIENYFGANVEGFDTYRYCAEETKLRSWIALPLAVGLFARKDATQRAILSTKLRKKDGLLTRSGGKTFWDRTTLYALRGLFNAGAADEAVELLETYSSSRLLGEHIPYPVESFPEGNQAQLSAESALYQRIYTEGILGFRPVGFGEFVITPHLPKTWDWLRVEKMLIAGKSINIFVERISNSDEYEMLITCGENKIKNHGKTAKIKI